VFVVMVVDATMLLLVLDVVVAVAVMCVLVDIFMLVVGC